MSDPVYRIEVEHTPADAGEWYAKAYRISDDTYMSGSGHFGSSSEEAVTAVRAWIAMEANRQEGFSVYADEDGNLVSEHSVKS